jgi:uncharacterized protein (DUF433 family)/DNA-binding transcriptional MerR regulator
MLPADANSPGAGNVPDEQEIEAPALTDEERWQIRQALRFPRGRYSYDRASQLSGIPQRTLHDWARAGIVVPDFDDSRPKHWSYRDLVFLRLVAWLRAMHMPREAASRRMQRIRQLLEQGDEDFAAVHSDGRILLLGDDQFDRMSGQQIFAGTLTYLSTFDLLAPVDVTELGRRRLWGPNLVRPSRRTAISPWVMNGEPCVRNTRVPTSSLFALARNRGLDSLAIAQLYPAVQPDAILDAIQLERRLRHLPAAA